MEEIGIDIETYSSNDLVSCGVYKYVEAEDFTILLFGYCVDGGPVTCVDLASGEKIPDEVLTALQDDSVIKTAFNATFERICLSRYLGLTHPLNPLSWRCTMVRAARLGLPLSLAQCGEVLHLEDRKMSVGRSLIRYFSVPNKVTKNKETRYVRHRPEDDMEKWELFKKYNIRDVEVEQAILRRVRRLHVPTFEDALYVADQEINDRGVLIDRVLVDNAARFDEEYKAELLEEAKTLTGMDNPNSPSQIKEYIARRTGTRVESLNKKMLDDFEAQFQYWPDVLRLLSLRRELGKTSNKKYAAMQQCVCRDGRIHGLLQFYGAARTGRWAGRLVQVQNLPQNHLEDLDLARRLVRAGDLDYFELSYDNVTHVLSELIRTSFVARPGCVFHVCDFSAIEARVIAWLAGEEWVLDVFRNGRDIYCETASKMFGVPVEKHGRNAHLRQRGKVAVLALGYGGGVSALDAMGGSRLGLSESEMKDIVRKWRDSNPHIVKLWRNIDRAAHTAIESGRPVAAQRGVLAAYKWGSLLVTLPSGRTLVYPRARLSEEDVFGMSIEYEGVNQTTKKWGSVRTYGGKLTENIVQAIARDILGSVLLRARAQRLDVVFHIHDEIVVEAREGQTLAMVEDLFSVPPSWCSTLPLKGAGYTTPYYLKD